HGTKRLGSHYDASSKSIKHGRCFFVVSGLLEAMSDSSVHGGIPFGMNMYNMTRSTASQLIMIGLAYGANTLRFAMVRHVFPVKEAGIVSGLANTGGFLSAILLPSIFGKV